MHSAYCFIEHSDEMLFFPVDELKRVMNNRWSNSYLFSLFLKHAFGLIVYSNWQQKCFQSELMRLAEV